mmetsp:Transcript_21509/g.50087  ORF Transcript_21509/g.50087 Transcript_21509/m.50087 type:complete len:193 (-) Transcript_21509:34-612(-)
MKTLLSRAKQACPAEEVFSAQVYIPDVDDFHAKGQRVHSPAFFAFGYMCRLAAIPTDERAIHMALQVFPSLCKRSAEFPFSRDFLVVLVDADNETRTIRTVVDVKGWAIRCTNENINPSPQKHSWTGGMAHRYKQKEVEHLNSRHIIGKVRLLEEHEGQSEGSQLAVPALALTVGAVSIGVLTCCKALYRLQ